MNTKKIVLLMLFVTLLGSFLNSFCCQKALENKEVVLKSDVKNIIIILDNSLTMRRDDYIPSKFYLVKQGLLDFIGLLDSVNKREVCLITFGKEVHTISPLSRGYDEHKKIITSLKIEGVNVERKLLKEALNNCLALVKQRVDYNNAAEIFVITDGINCVSKAWEKGDSNDIKSELFEINKLNVKTNFICVSFKENTEPYTFLKSLATETNCNLWKSGLTSLLLVEKADKNWLSKPPLDDSENKIRRLELVEQKAKRLIESRTNREIDNNARAINKEENGVYMLTPLIYMLKNHYRNSVAGKIESYYAVPYLIQALKENKQKIQKRDLYGEEVISSALMDILGWGYSKSDYPGEKLKEMWIWKWGHDLQFYYVSGDQYLCNKDAMTINKPVDIETGEIIDPIDRHVLTSEEIKILLDTIPMPPDTR